MRELILKRALVTQPFFAKLPFTLTAGAAIRTEYQSKLEVNRDFYVNGLQSNFGEVFTDTNAYFLANLYTGARRGLWRYDFNTLLPTGQQFYEARFDTVIAQEQFVDRQQEIMPFLVKNGEKVYAKIQNLSAKGAGAEAIICLKGFQLQPQVFIDSRTYAALMQSLEKPSRVEYFKFTVDQEGINQTKTIENDNFPRLVLGFAVRNSTADKANVSASSMTIEDITRKLRFNDDPIPVEFFAPRLTCLVDWHIYYLPVEYYLQPFAKLQFNYNNTSPVPLNPQGYEFSILTRTI